MQTGYPMEDNSQIYMTSQVKVGSILPQFKDILPPCVGVYYSPSTELIFATYEGGHCIAGRLEQDANSEFSL